MARPAKREQEMSAECNVATPDRASEFSRVALSALRDAGCRLTSTRMHVIRTLGESNRPLSANEIHARIRASGKQIDSVSVYRILSTLQAVGAVHRIGLVDAFYACGLQSDHVHDTQHFICEVCGCVSEVDVSNNVRLAVREGSSRLGFMPNEMRIEVLGLCEHCQTNEGPNEVGPS